MKNLFLFVFSSPLYLLAQVGIGTNSPNTSAKLEVSATDKGFLPPRVILTSLTDVSTITTPATGLLIYNTATAGTSPNNVTPGFYYYDGSKWQRLITQQPDATVEFDKATPTTSGVVFTPNTPTSKDYIYVSTVDNSQWIYNGTAYVTYTPPASTAWYLSGGTNDAGSNKTASIYRSGNLGIGTPTPSYSLDVKSTGFLLGRFDGTDHSSSSFGAIGVRGPVSNGNIFVGVGGAAVNNTSNNVRNKAFVAADPTLDGLNLRSDNSAGYVQITAGGVAATNEVARFTNSGNVGIGNTSPNARLDIRTNPTSTSDPGAGLLGIGTAASTAANTAGAGAVRYSTASGGALEFSNGTNWNTLTSNVQKATVVAKKTSAQSVSDMTSTDVTNWDEITDLTSNFNPTTGVFTAPRSGNYVVSFSFNFNFGAINAGTVVEAHLISSGGTTNDKKSVVSYPASGSAPAGAAITFTIKLASGETVKPVIWHSLGVTKTLRVGTGVDDGFMNFSVAEL
jgi:hypothetical protein